MCGHCKGCAWSMITKILLIIGGINWGLVGVGMLMSQDLNVVNMLLGSMPVVESVVYVLVGVAGVMSIFGCKCKKCISCQVETPSAPTSNTSM